MTRNLWGELPAIGEEKTPVQILKEQASVLNDLTAGILYGRVTLGRAGVLFQADLTIVAPALDHYTYEVVLARYPLEMYPLAMWPGWRRFDEEAKKEPQNESEFEAALAQILGSETVRRVIRSLVAQSRSAE